MRERGWSVVGAIMALLVLAWVSMVRAGMPAFEPLAPSRDVALGPPGCEPLVDCSDVPFAIAAGDFDRDGNADVATANVFTSDVSILLGDGTGALSPTAPLVLGEPAVDVAAADVDEDGVLDLVLAVESAEALRVAIGNGDGTFHLGERIDLRGSPPVSANPPSDVQVADLDHDGHLDLVTASLLANKVTVLLGRGDGTFAAPLPHDVEGGPGRLAIGDLDGDGLRDVAVSLDAFGEVAVLLGDGEGNLTVGDSAAVSEGAGAIVIADFDRDGKRDVAVAVEDLVDAVFVLRGNGDGTFEPAEEFEVGSAPTALVTADLDGDGRLDLLTADNFGSFEFDNSVSVLAGRGEGTFAPRAAFEVNVAPIDAVAVDLNNDRKPDVVTANMESNDVSVLLNVADGPEFVCAGDCDGDGVVSVTDLVFAVDLSMSGAKVESCPDADVNGDGMVGVDELIRAVRRALAGCMG